MDATRFDVLTRFIANRHSRRLTFKALAGGLTAGALSQIDLEPADAATCKKLSQSCKKRRGKPRPKCCAGTICKGDKCQCKSGRRKCGNTCITKNQCCQNKDCEGTERCDKKTNRCGCGKNQRRCNGKCIAKSAVCFSHVSPNNLHGWIPYGEDPFSPPAITTFVFGPDVPPKGNGSVRLDPADSSQQATIRTLKYVGQKIADITKLSYSIFVPEGGDPPTMQLAVLGVPTGEPAGFASLVYVPGAGTNPAPVSDTWSDYEPMDGQWQVTRNVFGMNDECLICRFNGPWTGSCAEPNACVGKELVSWQTILDAMPDAHLNGATEENGSFSFRIGRGDTGQGNLTNVVFNNDGYTFGPDN